MRTHRGRAKQPGCNVGQMQMGCSHERQDLQWRERTRTDCRAQLPWLPVQPCRYKPYLGSICRTGAA